MGILEGMKQTRKILPLTSAAIGALLLAGCGAGNTDQSATISPENESTGRVTDNPTDGSATPSESVSQTPSASSALTASQQAALAAVGTALADYQGGKAVELDHDDKSDTFEVNVVKDGSEHEVTTDGKGQNVTGTEDKGSVSDKDAGKYGRASLDLKEALQRAFQKAAETQGNNDAVLDEASLEEEGEDIYWKVELDSGGQDLDYQVNANTGTIQPKD